MRKIVKQAQKTQTVTASKPLHNVVGGKHKFTKFGTSFDTFSLKFKLDNKIRENYQILMYYVLPNGDVISDSREVEIESCLINKVSQLILAKITTILFCLITMQVHSEWLKNQVHPGEIATLSIKTSPNSLCSLSVVDEVTQIQSNENFNLKDVLKYFKKEKPNLQDLSSSAATCVKHIKKPPLGTNLKSIHPSS